MQMNRFFLHFQQLTLTHIVVRSIIYLLAFWTLVLNSASSNAQVQKHRLAHPKSLEFELIYVAPGNGTYSLFGHLAIRVKDRINDRIFDLGITRSIGLKGLGQVALGKALFHGEARSFPFMLKSWQRRDRSVTAYPINLPPKLKMTLLLELESRLQGVAQPYLYDPLRANCATQLRQALDNMSGGIVSASITREASHYQFREDTRDGYAKAFGVLMAIEFLVGTSLDQSQSDWASTYRPLTLVKHLKKLRVGGKKLLGPPKFYYIRQGSPTTGGYTIYYLIATLSVLTLLLLLFGWRSVGSTKPEHEQVSKPTNDNTSYMLQRKSWFIATQWICYSLSSIFLVCLFSLALYLSIFSEWIEVRNSWLLILGSPFDILLLTFNPWSSPTHRSWLFEAFKQRIVISMIMTLIFACFLTTLPTITLTLSMFLLWGACLLLLSCLGSPPQDHDQYEIRETVDTPTSWLDG